MAKIQISRAHNLGLAEARKVAFKWAEQAEAHLSMTCSYEEGHSRDEVVFKRSGVDGRLTVTKDNFELEATLGFLLGAFKDRIEREIAKNLDALLAQEPVKAVAQKSPVPKPAVQKPAAKKAAVKKPGLATGKK